MRVVGAAFLAGAFCLAVWLGLGGGADAVTTWAADGQRDTQNAMAGYLRALRRGDASAFMSLMALCFAYGFFHAAGPGHGKLVIGGYGLGSAVSARRLSAYALASGIAQALSAILLVSAGWYVLAWSRTQLTHLADVHMATLSAVAIALVGVWLFVRGILGMRRQMTRRANAAAIEVTEHGHEHGHSHEHHHHDHGDGVCAQCGHAHAPSAAQIEKVHHWRDAAILVSSIALRPCTGAIFLLLITYQMGVPWAGVAGAIAMGLGTSSITILVALLAVKGRQTALAQLAETSYAPWMAQIIAGGIVAALASQMVLAAL